MMQMNLFTTHRLMNIKHGSQRVRGVRDGLGIREVGRPSRRFFPVEPAGASPLQGGWDPREEAGQDRVCT